LLPDFLSKIHAKVLRTLLTTIAAAVPPGKTGLLSQRRQIWPTHPICKHCTKALRH